MDELNEIKELVLQYIRGIWKNRWYAVIIAFPLMMAGFLFVDQLKDRYLAVTKVYIDSASLLRPLLTGLAVESDFDSTVQLMVRKLLSRPSVERAIRMVDLDVEVETPREMEELLDMVMDRLSVTGTSRTWAT